MFFLFFLLLLFSASRGSSGSSLLIPPSYETFYGFDFTLTVNPLTFTFPRVFGFGGGTLTLGSSFGLPYSRTFTLVDETPFSCAWCSGCIFQSAPPAALFSYTASAWSICSAACGLGTQTRSIQCVNAAGTTVAPINCRGTPPSGSQACNLGPCAGALVPARPSDCPPACTPSLRGNSFCNAVCNSSACNWDGSRHPGEKRGKKERGKKRKKKDKKERK